jgi:hypothetical protein
MTPTPADTPLSERVLTRLLIECQEQIQRYRKQKLQGDSISCTEIVHRATRGDNEALRLLLFDISTPLIAQSVARDLREEVIAEARFRLLRRFRNQKRLLHFPNFATYQGYLKTTAGNIQRELAKAALPVIPMDDLGEESQQGYSEQEIIRRVLLTQQLRRILTSLEYELIVRRYFLGQSPLPMRYMVSFPPTWLSFNN